MLGLLYTESGTDIESVFCSDKNTRRTTIFNRQKAVVSSDRFFNKVHNSLYMSSCNLSYQSGGTSITDVKDKVRFCSLSDSFLLFEFTLPNALHSLILQKSQYLCHAFLWWSHVI